MKRLQDYLSEIKDNRRPQGRRFSLVSMLEMLVLAGMSGRFGVNAVSRFIKNNKEFFLERYHFVHGIPSQTMIHNFLKGLDFEELNGALKSWMMGVMESQGKSDQWISIDGKAIRSTVSDPNTSQQNYINLVSAFNNNMGLVIGATRHENKKSNEGASVRELIEKLELKGVSFTLDAIHCQKKLSKPSWSVEMTM
jgi:hypothetical protein